jgi:ketosteroid isomerase-like protein
MSTNHTDHAGIFELYGRYPFEIDGNNEEGLADCFTEDGVFLISGQGRFEGREEIKGLVAATAEGRPRHLTLNLWIREVEDGRAQTQAYFMLVDLKTGENVAYGHYEDRPVLCEDGRWRWQERRVQFEWTSEGYGAQDRAKAVPLPS